MQARRETLAANRRDMRRRKHERWAAEMEKEGWACEPPLPREIVDGGGSRWALYPDRLYRITEDARDGYWTRAQIAENYGIKEERW